MTEGMTHALPEITDSEFGLIADLVYEQSGIRLTMQKKTLVEGRLGKLIRKMRFPDFHTYYKYVMSDTSGKSLQLLLGLISTNHSFFFREPDHFYHLREHVLPLLEGKSTVRLWCAGCAGGEESYTLAMIIDDYFHGNTDQCDIAILATDISLIALEHAKKGVYDTEKISGLPSEYRKRYLQPCPGSAYTVADSIRRLILFKHFNLTTELYPFRTGFDVVFCRNVMIYFDAASRAAVIKRISRHMDPGAWLYIGHSETLGRDSETFRYIKPAVYQRI